jgi:hypothetical protein
MSLGAYGTGIPINLPNEDIPSLVDISYTYHENRTYDSLAKTEFKKLDSAVLTQATREESSENADNFVEGMYNLRLPLTEFNKKGFYTVYIKPREIRTVISDVGVLSSYMDVRGLVIDTTKLTEVDRYKFSTNNNLVGYRIVYINASDGSRDDYYRIVTSNNRCEPLTTSLTTSNQKIVSYRYNDSSTLTFITVTPSTAPSFKSNAIPFIGNVSQEVLFVNTKFEPIMIEIEMVDHDADTISNMLEGSQLRDLDNGIVTTYNGNNEIYHQSEHYTLKNEYTSVPIFEVKKNKTDDIDFTQTITDK